MMSRAKLMVRTFFAVAIAVLFWGCTTSNSQAPQFSATQAAHPATWVDNHWSAYLMNPNQCRTCHGSDLTGGVSGVTCFQCHHPNGPSHQPGWELPAQHGRNGAQLAPSTTTGFASCTQCHGSTYNNPVGTTPSCQSCHTKAPHPNKPWNGATASTPNHTFTAVGNAPECYKCHANGANSDLKPAFPAPTGTAPGCFNNTLCHSADIPH
jgi:hypothetical protein